MSNCVVFDVPLTIHHGCTFDKSYSWSIGDTDDDTEPVTMAGFTGEMFLKEKMKDEGYILQIPFQADAFVPDGPTGIYIDEVENTFRIYINDIDAAGLCPDKKDVAGYYTLLLKNSYGEVVLKQWGEANLILSY